MGVGVLVGLAVGVDVTGVVGLAVGVAVAGVVGLAVGVLVGGVVGTGVLVGLTVGIGVLVGWTVAVAVVVGGGGKLPSSVNITGFKAFCLLVLTETQSSCKIPPVSPELGFQLQKVQLKPPAPLPK